MISFHNGDMFDADTMAIVNTVNLVGVMGKGVALQFKERFRHNFNVYRQACQAGSIDIGRSLVVRDSWQGREFIIVNFPTKRHWRNPSEYTYIEKGLDDLVRIISEYNIGSIAIPPLGAGNGGLKWPVVKALICEKLKDVDCDVRVFEPGHKAVSLRREVKLTPARSLLLYMLWMQRREGYDITEFSSVKMAYFLQMFGGSGILRLNFIKYKYGPYCHEIKHMLHNLDGAYVRGFADNAKKAFEPFDIIEDTVADVRKMVEGDIQLLSIVSDLGKFLDGNWDDFSLELLSSVDYLISRDSCSTENDVYEGLLHWDGSGRKAKLFSDREVVRCAYEKVSGVYSSMKHNNP
ncbi:MAG: macro domain-containing protein [Prevotella sp.]